MPYAPSAARALVRVDRKRVLPVPAGSVRPQLLLRKGAYRVPDLLLIRI